MIHDGSLFHGAHSHHESMTPDGPHTAVSRVLAAFSHLVPLRSPTLGKFLIMAIFVINLSCLGSPFPANSMSPRPIVESLSG